MNAALVIRKGRKVFKDATTPLEREEFRDALKSELLNLASRYSSPLEEEPHIENISGLAKHLSEAYGKLLDGDLVFGRAQKALNITSLGQYNSGEMTQPENTPFGSPPRHPGQR